MRLPSGGRIKKLCENTHLSYDNISPLANYYQVANNCMVYPTLVFFILWMIVHKIKLREEHNFRNKNKQ
jgi:hypothetical protein